MLPTEVCEVSGDSQIAEIARFRAEVWLDDGGLRDPEAVKSTMSYSDPLDLERSSVFHFVIRDDRKLVAAARLSIHAEMDFSLISKKFMPYIHQGPFPFAWLSRLVVHPGYRGRGFAGRMDIHRIGFAAKQGARCVLGTPASELRVKQLKKLGLAEVYRGGMNPDLQRELVVMCGPVTA